MGRRGEEEDEDNVMLGTGRNRPLAISKQATGNTQRRLRNMIACGVGYLPSLKSPGMLPSTRIWPDINSGIILPPGHAVTEPVLPLCD
jgi:hypothetical protein